MQASVFDIEKLTVDNNERMKILNTTKEFQIAVVSLKQGEELEMEVHENSSQFSRVESGKCVAITGQGFYQMGDGDAIVVPSGKAHRIVAITDVKLYTIYAPPVH